MIENDNSGTCDRCGSGIQADSRFCVKCGAPVGPDAGTGNAARGGENKKLPKPEVEPWAVKTGERVRSIPGWIKFGIPIAILVIVAIIVALLVIAGAHTAEATVNDYLSRLQRGDYKGAYEMTVKQGGRYSTLAYFESWQNTTAEKLGRLKDFSVQPRKAQNRIFGRLVLEQQATGSPFVASLSYSDRSFDVNITAEDAGGTWPFSNHRLRLSDQSTRILASPIGTGISIDGLPAGESAQDKSLQDALSLNHFPKDLNSAVDYVKKLRSAIEGFIDSGRRIISGLGLVEGQVQNTFNKFGQSGISWSQVLDSLKRTADVGRGVGDEVARTIVHLYWTFGGGNDGTLRSELARTEPVLDVTGMPEGYHWGTFELKGCRPQTKEFFAPDGATVELSPTFVTTTALETAVEAYYRERSIAEYTLNNANLPTALGGTALDEENATVFELATRGQKVASQLVSVKYGKPDMLTETVASMEADEVWNFAVYQGATPSSVMSNVKQKAVYTLQRDGGNTWKVIERKVKK
jgi:hypothetical protein